MSSKRGHHSAAVPHVDAEVRKRLRGRQARFDRPEIRLAAFIHNAGGGAYETRVLTTITKLLTAHSRTANCTVTKVSGTDIISGHGLEDCDVL